MEVKAGTRDRHADWRSAARPLVGQTKAWDATGTLNWYYDKKLNAARRGSVVLRYVRCFPGRDSPWKEVAESPSKEVVEILDKLRR